MSQQPEENPVRNGLVALVAVALSVGLILAVVALIGTHVLGLSGGDDSDSGAGAGESMYLPSPAKTTEGDGPLITLNTEDTSEPSSSATASDTESDSASESATGASKGPKKGQISLQALETTVPNFGKIDLTGTFPGGEGEILQVQRKQGGAWVDFTATVPVSNATFSTYIQTGVAGVNTFRVLDKARNIASNTVDITVK